ncbi:spore germination protein [Alkalihalobacterium elongatum]|uniref:spore germination protein n=1 Tax=Alkalihalobacterium elongatum TaxID=2675466 RepID=UPI001C1FA997|nr:spore germination protein [Alkalihalobacterium elongatum]
MKLNFGRLSGKPTIEELLKKGVMDIVQLKQLLKGYSDIQFVPMEQDEVIISFYCEGMTDIAQLNDYYYSVVNKIMEPHDNHLEQVSLLELPPIERIHSIAKMFEKLFSGFLILYKVNESFFYGVDISKIPQRVPAESTTEVSIKGPKDAFTEELNVNISLIRKRLKTKHLMSETFTIGTLSQTKVALLYLNNKASNDLIQDVKERLDTFETESIVSSGQLEQWLSDRTFSLYPLFDHILRPDFVVECLLRGRFILIIDGSPVVIIGPINLFELIKSPEDVHFPYYFVIFQRVIRLIGIYIAIFLPGFWIAISSVNLDQIPFPLLATVVVARDGLPFPAAVEAFFILGLFELLREAGVRMPRALGQTISIVGGLIIGDAAIRAGLASPSLIVIIALTAVATYTLVNQSLTGTVTVLRLYSLLISSFLGLYGFFLTMFSILIYLCRLESFKISYLEPIASLNFKEFLSALSLNPLKRKKWTIPLLQKWRRS